MSDNVRCKDCGLLMIRDAHSSEARSADETARGRAQYMSSLTGRFHTAKFLCRANSPAFCGVDTDSGESQVASINKEINCDSFMPWHRAKTAEEHEEMTLLEKVKEENSRSRAEERAEQRLAREEDLARATKWRNEDRQARLDSEDATAKRFRWQELRLWVAVAISILALTVSAIVAAYNYPK